MSERWAKLVWLATVAAPVFYYNRKVVEYTKAFARLVATVYNIDRLTFAIVSAFAR